MNEYYYVTKEPRSWLNLWGLLSYLVYEGKSSNYPQVSVSCVHPFKRGAIKCAKRKSSHAERVVFETP